MTEPATASRTVELDAPRAAPAGTPARSVDDPFGFHLLGPAVEPRARSPMQCRATATERTGADANADAVHDVAARATAGRGGPLPHLDVIQRAFGPHDVSGVRAHTDEAAIAGASALGAHAFATGNHVAFAHHSDGGITGCQN